jgi:hypothetical protein
MCICYFFIMYALIFFLAIMGVFFKLRMTNFNALFAGTVFTDASCCHGSDCGSSHAHVPAWCSWSWSAAVLWSATPSLYQSSGKTKSGECQAYYRRTCVYISCEICYLAVASVVILLFFCFILATYCLQFAFG